MAKLEVKNNGCAEVAYADIYGKALIFPGESTIDMPDKSVKPLIETMKRRAPYVFIKLIVDDVPKPAPKKKTSKKKSSKKPKQPAGKAAAEQKKPSIDGGK